MESLLWLLLEAGVALGLVIALVWWTLPRRKRAADERDGADKDRG